MSHLQDGIAEDHSYLEKEMVEKETYSVLEAGAD